MGTRRFEAKYFVYLQDSKPIDPWARGKQDDSDRPDLFVIRIAGNESLPLPRKKAQKSLNIFKAFRFRSFLIFPPSPTEHDNQCVMSLFPSYGVQTSFGGGYYPPLYIILSPLRFLSNRKEQCLNV